MAEYELRRLQSRLTRLESEAELYRRGSFDGMQFMHGGTAEERASDCAREIALATSRLRELLNAGAA